MFIRTQSFSLGTLLRIDRASEFAAITVKDTGTFSLFHTSRIQSLDDYNTLPEGQWEAVRSFAGTLARLVVFIGCLLLS